MKKLLAVVLLAAMILSFTACSSASSQTAAPAADAETPDAGTPAEETPATETSEAAGTPEEAVELKTAELSPEWVASLAEAATARQLFVVAGVGETTAYISMHEKDGDGVWRQIMTTPGYIGKYGLGKTREGDGKTPVGTFHFNYAFGIAEDPGCALPYRQVTEDDYWSGDQRDGYGYNRMVSIRDLPDLNTGDSEHIVEYVREYQYCLNISYNADGTPGLGSAIFLHCLGAIKPYTGGCVAIPMDRMLTVMRNVREDCVVVIDSLRTLSPDTWNALKLSPAVIAPTEDPLPGIAAIYSAGAAQIITREDGSKELADTVIYIYHDGSYRQYVMIDGVARLFSEGSCVLNGELDSESPVIITLTVRKVFMNGMGPTLEAMSFDINLSDKDNYCLYPIGAEDKEIAAAFLQADKQKLVKEDGSTVYLPTVWVYYSDGTFRQHALPGGREAILFSTGEYSVDGDFSEKDSVLTIHRNRKYMDGIGLADYDSTHDYVVGELDFIRIYPEQVIGREVSIPTEYADELIVKTGEAGMLITVLEKASVEAALDEGGDDDGAGWLFSIGTVSAEELHAMLCQDMSGMEVFAKDVEGRYYLYYHPTDVRMVRKDGGYNDESMARWAELNEWAASVRTTFVNDNDGLIAVTFDNSDPAIALSRAAWEDGVNYEIRALEFGQHGSLLPAGTDAAPYAERLIRNAEYEYADPAETPDGEYIVLAFPEDGVRYDFFSGGDYVRRTNDDGTVEELYRVTLPDGEAPWAVMQEWAKALAEANGLT